MVRPDPSQQSGRSPRERIREIITFLIAFVFALVVGRAIIQLAHTPPTLVQFGIFLVLYGVAYIGLWRLVSSRIPLSSGRK